MARVPVFLSFDYSRDAMRVQQVRNMGAIEGNTILSSNDWEKIRQRGDSAIRNWIDSSMKYKRCLIVLIGSRTATRRWVKYEIDKAWEAGKGVFGIYIHNLRDPRTGTSTKGANPFANIRHGLLPLSFSVNTYDPPAGDAYSYIARNIQDWVETAISDRKSIF